MSHTDLDQVAIENFRNYIRIPTISNITDYEDCIKFLETQANSLDLQCLIVRLKPNRPVVIMKWIGTNPELPTICLNNHMDVVPVEEDKWTYPPFSAHMDEETGKIYGRGTQDMKLNGIQQLEAIRRMKLDNIKLKRTIVLTFVPDEEVGGQEGMALFVKTAEFQDLNIGLTLDEGGASGALNKIGENKNKKLLFLYGEKHKWSVKFHVKGDVGHGSLLLPNTAAPKLTRLLKSMDDFRQEQIEKAGGQVAHDDVTSLNVTIIEGGQQDNVIPSEFIVTTDIRLYPKEDPTKWRQMLTRWCQDAGEGVYVEEIHCEIVDIPTKLDESNKFYLPVKETLNSLGFDILPMISPGVTDARFMRNLGIPAFGITSLTRECLAHCHDEYVDKEDFLQGITMYYKLLERIGNLD